MALLSSRGICPYMLNLYIVINSCGYWTLDFSLYVDGFLFLVFVFGLCVTFLLEIIWFNFFNVSEQYFYAWIIYI
jgi:hypothetical protein